jgi:phage terminase large subunit
MILTEKQKQMYDLISKNRFLLAEGGARSGKTIAAVNFVFLRAIKYPRTDHVILRLHFNHVKLAIGSQTIPQLSHIKGVNFDQYLNRTDYIYELPNGSKVWLAGSDNKDRVERILGREYQTIMFDELSTFDYDTVETILTRLNGKIPLKIIATQNPGGIGSWIYKVFHKREFPDGSPAPDDDYAYIQMNPMDNPHVSDTFIKTLEGLSAANR